MLVRMILACSAILLMSLVARAQECQSLGQADREARIQKAPTCDTAMEAFSDCAYGASGDVGLADIATDKCEAEFLQKISVKQRRAYIVALKHCDDKYENMESTMYIAMAAGCRAELAQSYARKFSKSQLGKSKVGKRKRR
jgi:hypothetical protein